MDIKKELGQKIKRIRKQKNITQEQLAEMADISLRTLGGIEIGETFMRAQTLEKILTCLGVSLNELFDCAHLKSTPELINEIALMLNDIANNREKVEEIYKVVKAITSI